MRTAFVPNEFDDENHLRNRLHQFVDTGGVELKQRWRKLYDGIIDVNYLPDTIDFVNSWQSAFEAVSALPWNLRRTSNSVATNRRSSQIGSQVSRFTKR